MLPQPPPLLLANAHVEYLPTILPTSHRNLRPNQISLWTFSATDSLIQFSEIISDGLLPHF
jgi:hypothetical protein